MKKEIKKRYIEENFDIFNYKNLGSVRTLVDEYDEKWFCLSDICHILDIRDTYTVAKRIPEPYTVSNRVGVQTGIKTDGTPAIQYMDMTFVNQSGMFLAIGKSRKPEAEKFMLWIFDEVLPSLNKRGYYIMSNKTREEVIQELQEEVATLRDRVDYLTKIEIVHKETVIGYASRNNIPLTPKLIKKLEAKAILESRRCNFDYDESPNKLYNEIGYITFKFSIVEYVFKHYYDEFVKECELDDKNEG